MPGLLARIILVPLCLTALISPAHAFLFGSSGPDPSLEKARTLGAEVKERTATVWNEVDKHVELLLKYHQVLQQLSPKQVNALTEQDLARQMDLHLQWAKKFDELRAFIGEEYGLFIEKVKSSDIAQGFKEAIVKHYDGTFRDAARENMYPYLNGIESINQSLFETYRMISAMRFPPKGSARQAELLTEKQLGVLKSATSEKTIEKIKGHRHEFHEFLQDFHFNPLDDSSIYQAGRNFFARDEKLLNKIEENFTKAYLKDGAFKAEANMKFFTSNTLNTELPGALPKASAETLVKFAAQDVDILKIMAIGSTGGGTKSCLLFADAKEFVGVDFNEIANSYYSQDAVWKVKGTFRAANDVIASSKAAPADFSAGREQAEQLLELGKKSAAAEVMKSPLYKKLTQKNKFSPRRYCFMRYTLLQELLKLPSPAREDTLRLLYLEDLEKRVKNMQTAAAKK